MNDCIFCLIRDGKIKSEIVYEDEDMFIIKDIYPIAKKHYLAIPKKHYKLIEEANEQDALILGKMLKKIPKLSNLLGIENGYRLIINQGKDAGQTVFHLHIHILGGQVMQFPKV